jgi:calcineurin-like phosphoesterase family protein
MAHHKRNFLTSDEMDEVMIEAWNSTVKPGDLVYHLGDFAITGYSKKYIPSVEKLLKKLHGNKILIRGNHDATPVLKAKGWQQVYDIHQINIDDQRIVMCHYAMRTWHFKSQGSIHLYGHSHGKLPSLDKSMDVGVDAMGYKPIKLERILEIMDKIEIGSNERL